MNHPNIYRYIYWKKYIFKHLKCIFKLEKVKNTKDVNIYTYFGLKHIYAGLKYIYVGRWVKVHIS